MATFTGLVVLFFVAFGAAVFAYERGSEYVEKVRENPKDVAVRLAKLNLFSYFLTSVPLIGGLMILLGRDPTFIAQQVQLPSNWSDFATGSLGLIASIGIGAGLARRRWALKVAASR